MSTQPKLPLSVLSLPGAADDRLRRQVMDLARTAQVSDGNPPFSEQTFIDLAAQQADRSLLGVYAYAAEDSTEELLLGAAIAVRGAETEPWTVELVVHPDYRQRQVAGNLLQQLGGSLDLSQAQGWAHGAHPAAQVLAERHGLQRQRELNKMRRTQQQPLPVAQLPENLQLRTFVPGQDEQAWLQANAAAFADHPEQGSLTLADLQARMAEDWFDPEGFFLAVDQDGAVLGFHWTKLPKPEPGTARVGEVYVVGVTPGAQGLGLGRSLTATGVNHLLARGVEAVMLYVDAENTAAVKLYESLGFTVWDVDVMYGPAR
jgi:mycothiol synthase